MPAPLRNRAVVALCASLTLLIVVIFVTMFSFFGSSPRVGLESQEQKGNMNYFLLTYRAYSAMPYPADEQRALHSVVRAFTDKDSRLPVDTEPGEFIAAIEHVENSRISVAIYHQELFSRTDEGVYELKPEFRGRRGEPDPQGRSREFVIDATTGAIESIFAVQ